MAILEAIVEEANSIGQQIKRHTFHLLTGKQKEEFNPEHPVVLLIHGYFINNVHLKGLQDFLISQGFNIVCESYPYNRQDLNEIESQIVSSQIKKIHQQTGEGVNLAGYSAGGLIARSVAQNYPQFIDKVVTLGAPHQGTLAALLAPFVTGVRQMLPYSDYIQELNQAPIPENVDFYSIYSPYDQMVIPSINATIPSPNKNVKNLPIETVGHWGLVGEKVYPLIVDILKE